ncbi:MAG: stage II sporulation protein P [Armatimonadetes bacterium]|nr:stage II sporulation protein P [Armatimonadota bacterium]
MKKVKSRIFIGLGLLAVGLSLLIYWGVTKGSLPAAGLPGIWRNIEDELAVGKACTIKDEQGGLVTMLSRRVRPGDEVITAEGKHYRVRKVAGDEAVARLLGMDRDLLAYQELFSQMEVPAAKMAWGARPVAIYHTHSDESYLPSDGADSIPFRGGIFQVGDSYSGQLSQNGARVLHDKTPHDPHDDNAYYRSRRTAAQLLKKNPIAIFDVHRDGVEDAGFYRRIISNQDVAQARLVVGRENPRLSANLDFARRLMAYANQTHWPIIKEIFIGQGNYNQDLLPTALLIEAGTYTNRKDQAMRGISQLADAVPAVLGITGPSSRPGAPEFGKPVTDPTARQGGGWAALAWIIIITIIGGGTFLVISSGGWNKAKERLRYFFGREFADFLGPRLRKITWKKNPEEK